MSQPINVSDSAGTESRWGQVAFGPDGKLHIVWEERLNYPYSDIFYMSYDGLNWDGPVNLSNASENRRCWRPYVCTNNNGWVFVVWGQGKTDLTDITQLREWNPITKQWLDVVKVSAADVGGGAPRVAADDDQNVYIIWQHQGKGKTYSRCRINGEWEDIRRMNSRRSEHVAITAGDDGRIWAMWLEKQPSKRYKVYYSKRTKNTDWATKKIIDKGSSHEFPHLDVSPDNVLIATWRNVGELEPKGEIWVSVIDENRNPHDIAVGNALHHFPRVAVDSDGDPHLVWQIGPGGSGTGIKYKNKKRGNWSNAVVMENSGGGPEAPGISADRGGNVAIVWSASVSGRNKEIWLSTLYPVLVLHAPSNLNMTISIDNLKETPEMFYDLSWEPNPENDLSMVKGYNLYKRENNGPWEFLLSVTKETHSASFTFSGSEHRITLGIKTVSVYNTEGTIGIFGID
jgi:hypothetical protein